MNSGRFVPTLLLLAACAADDFSSGARGDAGPGEATFDTDGDAGAGATTTGGKPALFLAPAPATTAWSRLPIHGTGPRAGSVLIQAPAASSIVAQIGSDGSFCADVPLQPGRVNELVLLAIAADGQRGNPVTISVEQKGSPPPAPPPAPTRRNVAKRSALISSDTVAGDLATIVDGDRGTAVVLSDVVGEDWVWIALSDRASIQSIVVASTEDCKMTSYALMLSDAISPGSPYSGSDDWEYAEVEATDAVMLWTYDAPTTVRHVGLRFLSSDCGDWWTGVHHLAEIEIWTPEVSAPPAPLEAPSCQGGG